MIEHLAKREVLCVHCPKTLTIFTGGGIKILGKWIQCLYIKVIDRLFVATSQSLYDRRKELLRLDASHLPQIRDLTKH